MKYKYPTLIIAIFVLIQLWKKYYDIDIKNKYQHGKLLNIYEKFKHRFYTKTYGNPLYNIDEIYCIVAPSRKKYIEQQFMNLNIRVTFFNGIFPKDLSRNDYINLSDTYKQGNNIYKKKTKLPVQLSFTMCMLDAIEKGHKTIMVFEDDIKINVSKHVLEKSIREFIYSPFDAFYMGYCWMSCKQEFDKSKYEYLVEVPDTKLWCNHAVVLKGNILPELIDSIFPLNKPKDIGFQVYFKINNKKICVPKFSYFNQDKKTYGSMNENFLDIVQPTCDLT